MNLEQLFKGVSASDPELFFKAEDPNDLRLGAVVETEPAAYQDARFVIISCSQDIGVARNHGRTGAALAPEAIRRSFYKLAAPVSFQRGDLIDLGDTLMDGSLEEIHTHHYEVMRQLVRDGKQVLMLGGGNDLSYPDAKALQSVFPEMTAVNIDAHLDIRENPLRNSGTPYRQLIEENIVQKQRFFEIGFQSHANSAHYLQQAADWGINLISLEELTRSSVTECLTNGMADNDERALFLGFDMDSVKAADAPGVSAPSPTGLSAEQARDLVSYFANRMPAKILEITEVNPTYDLDNRTAKLAAILMVAFLAASRKAPLGSGNVMKCS
jgi:formiminoglutamase